MDVKIYKPIFDEISKLVPLWEAQYVYHNNLDPVYYVNNSDELKQKFVKYIQKAIEKDEPRLLIANTEDNIIGFITYEIEDNDYMDTKITRCGVIIELFVHESYRQKGIATSLMEKAEDYFKENDVKHIEIQLSSFNKQAMKFYENKGFVNRQTFVFKEIR